MNKDVKVFLAVSSVSDEIANETGNGFHKTIKIQEYSSGINPINGQTEVLPTARTKTLNLMRDVKRSDGSVQNTHIWYDSLKVGTYLPLGKFFTFPTNGRKIGTNVAKSITVFVNSDLEGSDLEKLAVKTANIELSTENDCVVYIDKETGLVTNSVDLEMIRKANADREKRREDLAKNGGTVPTEVILEEEN